MPASTDSWISRASSDALTTSMRSAPVSSAQYRTYSRTSGFLSAAHPTQIQHRPSLPQILERGCLREPASSRSTGSTANRCFSTNSEPASPRPERSSGPRSSWRTVVPAPSRRVRVRALMADSRLVRRCGLALQSRPVGGFSKKLAPECLGRRDFAMRASARTP